MFSHSQTMASARPYWDHHHAMNSMYFCFNADSIENNLKTHQQGTASTSFERKIFGSCSLQSPSHQFQPAKSADPSKLLLSTLHSPPEGDQVVPSFQKLSVYEQAPPYSPRRISKPLPPLPDIGDISSDEAVDSEVEFFSSNSENQLLVTNHTSKPLPFRYGVPGRRSFRGCGQINYAYHDGLLEQEKVSSHKPEQVVIHRDRDNLKQQERPQRKLRRTNSGPAGSFKPPINLRSGGFQHPSYSSPQEKPEVPPRIPIQSSFRKNTDHAQDTDQPPEIPPRQPIFYTIPRAPSPKSLPIYVNGVMPPTQSFAPNPKYVSKAQQRQNCESVPAPHNPCILPIMEDGKKASATHYFLLPRRPGYLDKFERFFKESGSGTLHS